jgi:hypothetical protein
MMRSTVVGCLGTCAALLCALGLVVAAQGAPPVAARDAGGPSIAAQGFSPVKSDAGVRYSVGSWEPERLGTYRAVVRVAQPADAVTVHIPWRRRDLKPETKNLIVTDAKGTRVTNVAPLAISRASGDIAFAAPAAGDYYVYYLPNTGAGKANYPKVAYPAFENTAAADWLSRNHLAAADLASKAWQQLPRADVVELQSNGEFDAFWPMEVVATEQETSALLAAHPAPFLLFPEDRQYSIRMTDDLPLRWIEARPGRPFRGEAMRGEFYVFQVGVFAARQAIEIAGVTLTDANPPAKGGIVPSFRCFNLAGTDAAGARFTRRVAVERGKVQALWCGVQVPDSATPGEYRGRVTVTATGLPPQSFDLTIAVSPTVIPAAGDDEPARLSRLRWLDSTLAMDDEVVRPYTPVQVTGRTLGILGRKVTLGDSGFPDRIESYFAPEMTKLSASPKQVLAAPLALKVDGEAGPLAWKWAGPPQFVTRAPGTVAWETRASAGALRMTSRGQIEFDGTVDYVVTLTADRAQAVGDVRLEIPIARDVATYMMGMGLKGGLRPATFDWTWNVERNQDSAWIGDVNAGLQFSMRDERYVRPLNTNFYQLKHLVMPRSWENGGKGGCRFRETATAFLVECASGGRTIQPGEVLHYDFRLLLTPFHTLNTKSQWSTRFFHAYKGLDEVATTGANTLNIHHANEINPYINYPFLRVPQMKAYIDAAHTRGYKVKIYYTVRELTNRAPEIFALRSLGEEVLIGGPGGGPSWLQEHVGGHYIAGWYVPTLKDAAIVTSGVSRWHNFYIEGLAWLVKNVGIDGLYIDDVAFDRTTMKRVRKVLDRGRPTPLIDLHSANQFNIRDGFTNSANLYLEHFPFLDRLWFGEYFDYNSAPDFWMVETSGIPFGLMGEMLEGGGNPWRGMIYGMTNRLPWTTNSDPRPLWKFWDDFGMDDTEMLGYWVPSAPVRTSRPEVLATTYMKPGKALVSVASWAKDPVEVALQIDWKRLGLDPATVTITAPAIEKFQDARTFKVGDPIPVEPSKGWLLVLQ